MPKYVFFRQYAVRPEPAIGYGQKDAKKKIGKMLSNADAHKYLSYFWIQTEKVGVYIKTWKRTYIRCTRYDKWKKKKRESNKMMKHMDNMKSNV